MERYEYDVYGEVNILSPNYEPRTNSSYANTYTFTGRELDTLDNGNLKKMHYRYRDYSVSIGRFYQEDFLEYLDSLNLYLYVNNNPLGCLDPMGLLNYKKGTDDPTITPDVGAGIWDSEPETWALLALKSFIVANNLNLSIIWPDATDHLMHYFENTGSDYNIKLQKMIDDVFPAFLVYNYELTSAQLFAESLPNGTYPITSGTVSHGYNLQEDNVNWYYAVAGYSAWGKGVVTRCGDEFEMQFEYKFYDRYNWDTGKSATIFGITITDEFMGDFHRQGLAREFNMYGSVKKTVKWKKGEIATVTDGWDTGNKRGER